MTLHLTHSPFSSPSLFLSLRYSYSNRDTAAGFAYANVRERKKRRRMMMNKTRERRERITSEHGGVKKRGGERQRKRDVEGKVS